ncbi:vegetative incompatibility protein het-e-1 [Fusarium flagelliforme]|uniref:Vegetative incompatibility protein het-e-1 n=1 Tax=Fusarium flagelliforme TaxID=2675880 RepID=A0A395MLJ1_9HYPO|nr:vegetative incompatibility protein het-e-1 [Fusarium flagelliforme]
MAEALGVVSSVIAVVDLSTKVFSLCLQYSREVKNAKDDIERLGKEVGAFQDTTKKLQALVEGPRGQDLSASQQLLSTIEDGRSRLERLGQQLQTPTRRKVMSKFGARALKWPFKRKDVDDIIQNFARCRENISLALNIDQTVILQKIDDRTTLHQLPLAHGASFDSKAEEHNSTCLPGTRHDLLRDIDRWIDNHNSKIIFWLNGKAGTGKSTISRTVAWSRSRQGDLGASFFFKRGEVDQGNLAKFVPTVARRLAWSTPVVAPFIKSAVDADPAIADKSVREQFEKLVQEPLSKATATVTSSRLSVVIVVDALDECEKDADIKLLLQLFSNLRFAGPLCVRVLVTSRPELPVRLGFSSIGNAHQELVLHEIPPPIIKHDISIFLHHEFANIRNSFNGDAVEELKLPADWPGEANLETLTEAAVPLFIFAATLCRFINDRYLGSPDELLRNVLSVAGAGQGSRLDMAYSPVLKQQVANRSGNERLDIIESFRLVVGTIVTLANPLSMRALALLLDVHINKVTTRLMRLLHLSFRDYLVCLENKELVEFLVDEGHTHEGLAKHCLRIMSGSLRRNICGLSFPGVEHDWDACLLTLVGHEDWVGSVAFSHDSKRIASGSNERAIRIWNAETGECERWLGGHTSYVSSVVFSHNSKKLASAGGETIRIWNLEAGGREQELRGPGRFCSTVVFSHDSKKVASASEKTIRIWNAETGDCEQEINGENIYDGFVKTLAFSHDSKKIASSGGMKIRIWNAETGDYEQELQGHHGITNSAVFSHDSKWIASASDDKTVRIWNLETGECEQELKGHGTYVSSIVFSHDSKKVASGSYDKTIRIWNVETGKCERVLEGHSHWVKTVAFSHDSKKVASGSHDETIRIWDAEAGRCKPVVEGHGNWVTSVVFSPDSRKLATGSYDDTIRIWDTETGECEEIIQLDDHADVQFFEADGRGIITDRGVFSLKGDSQSHATPPPSSEEQHLGCTDGTWITVEGQNLLWLPPECRNGKSLGVEDFHGRSGAVDIHERKEYIKLRLALGRGFIMQLDIIKPTLSGV